MAIGRTSFSGIIAAFWLIFWSARLLSQYDWLMRSEDGRLLFILYIAMILLGVLFLGWLLLKKHAPKMMYSVNRSSRCPDCYSKLEKGTEFCPKCGKDLRERDESRICWYCGYEELDPNSTSCPKCGREFKKD